MEPFRLKLKVGQHEFEAEGEQDVVEKQLAIWRDLIASPSSVAPTLPSPPTVIAGGAAEGTAVASATPGPESREELDRLFDHRGPVVSLTMLPVGPQREADAALLLLYGQRFYNGAENSGGVTGGRLLEGLRLSGLSVERVDRIWGAHDGVHVIRAGSKRGVRYRLTHPGLARAREIAQGLLNRAV